MQVRSNSKKKKKLTKKFFLCTSILSVTKARYESKVKNIYKKFSKVFDPKSFIFKFCQDKQSNFNILVDQGCKMSKLPIKVGQYKCVPTLAVQVATT